MRKYNLPYTGKKSQTCIHCGRKLLIRGNLFCTTCRNNVGALTRLKDFRDKAYPVYSRERHFQHLKNSRDRSKRKEEVSKK